jgi:hypothetical protein
MAISPDKAHDRALKANAALRRLFLDQAGGDRELAERLRSEWYSELGKRSGSRRRAKAAARRAAELPALQAAYGGHLPFVTDAELLRMAREQARRRWEPADS